MEKLFWPLFGISLVQVAVEFLTLPANPASHFGVSGQPDAAMSRTVYCVFHLFIVILLTAAFGSCKALLGSLPTSHLNLPHKDYWLAPERRAASLDRLDGAMKSMGSATLLLVVVAMFLAHRANLQQQPLDTVVFLTSMLIYLGLTVWNLRGLLWAFPPPGTS